MTELPEPRRRLRRVRRPTADGVDAHPADHPLSSPAAEDRPEAWGEGKRRGANSGRRAESGGHTESGSDENDERLRLDRPPHW